MPELTGYRATSLRLLEEARASIGDLILVKTAQAEYEGLLMPRYEYDDDQHIVIKLSNGYNIGIRVDKVRGLVRISEGAKPTFVPPPEPRVNPDLPKVSIISTGGTIASRVDYRTGGVHPALTASDLYTVVPELSNYARVEAEILFSIYSENMTTKHWTAIANKVAEKVHDGSQGVVITHGTDTMGYTSTALSFALNGIPIPVALVGSQRSSDRPSSDSALNLIGAVILATRAPFSGVYVVMHSGMSDDALAVHLGTKVRKNHTSRRDAFESVNISPVAFIRNNSVEQILGNLPKRTLAHDFKPKPEFEEKVALIKFHPNFYSGILDYFINEGYHGLVLEGTGLGHVGRSCYEPLRRAIKAGILVGISSQCIWGRVSMTVYETGRDLLSIGVLPLDDMLSETALVKMMWVLANSRDMDDAKRLMMTNISGEYSVRSPLERRPAK